MFKGRLRIGFIAAMSSVLAMAGCSQASNSSGNTDQTGTGNKINLTFWYPWGGLDEEHYKKMVAKFEQLHPNYTVTANLIENSGIDKGKLSSAIAGGHPPDLTLASSLSVTMDLAIQGALTDMTPYATEQGISLNDYLPAFTDGLQFNGKLYGIPGMGANYSMLIINKKALRESGIDENTIPATFDDINRLSTQIDKISGDGTINKIAFTPLLMPDYTLWANIFGAKLYSDDGTQVVFNKDPKFLEFVKWLKGHADKYGYKNLSSLLQANKSSDIYSTGNNPFYQGKVVFYIEGSWMGKYMLPYIDAKDLSLQPLPTVHPGEASTLNLDSEVFLIPKGAKHPKEAMEFIKMYESTEEFAPYADSVGNLATTKDALAKQKLSDDPLFKPVFESLKTGKPLKRPLVATGQLKEILGKAIDDILISNADIQSTLDDAANRIQIELTKKLKK